MEQKTLFPVKEEKKILTIEITPEVKIYYNKYLTPKGLVVEQVITRKVSQEYKQGLNTRAS